MTSLRKIDEDLLEAIDEIKRNRDWHESDLCDELMYVLSRLEIGHNRVTRFWMAQELYILLSQGKDALHKHRKDEANGWG